MVDVTKLKKGDSVHYMPEHYKNEGKHNCVVWGPLVQVVEKYVNKGDLNQILGERRGNQVRH